MLDRLNYGTLSNPIDGISGVSSGGNALSQLPVDRRYHFLQYQCSAVNYTGGSGLVLSKITASGSPTATTATLVVVNGVPSTIGTFGGTNTGWTAGDTFTVVDATGTGAVFTVGTVSSGAITAATYNANSATASPMNPALFLTAAKIQVNGILMRDITPQMIQMICQGNGENASLGEFDIFFVDPWRKFILNNDATAWDMVGQSTFTVTFTIASNLTLPSLTGTMTFDYIRNTIMVGGKAQVYLEPVSQHFNTIPLAAGQNNINTIPFNYPIARLWLLGSVPGLITKVQLLLDNNIVIDATTGQLFALYERYGFQFGQGTYTNQNQTTQKTLGYNPLQYFDVACIADYDQRFTKAFKATSSLVLRVTSSGAQQLTVISELLPGAYSA